MKLTGGKLWQITGCELLQLHNALVVALEDKYPGQPVKVLVCRSTRWDIFIELRWGDAWSMEQLIDLDVHKWFQKDGVLNIKKLVYTLIHEP